MLAFFLIVFNGTSGVDSCSFDVVVLGAYVFFVRVPFMKNACWIRCSLAVRVIHALWSLVHDLLVVRHVFYSVESVLVTR